MLANSEHEIIPPEKRKKRLVVYNHGKAEDVRARASDVYCPRVVPSARS